MRPLVPWVALDPAPVAGLAMMTVDEFARLWPDINREVARVLTNDGVAWWLNMYVPNLGSTVTQALRSGRASEVLALTASYLDPSYG